MIFECFLLIAAFGPTLWSISSSLSGIHKELKAANADKPRIQVFRR